MILRQVQRSVNTSDGKILVESQMIARQNQIVEIDADLEHSDFVVAGIEQFQLFEVPRVDFNLRNLVVVQMKLINFIIRYQESYQSVVGQVENVQREIREGERMNLRN